MSDTALLSATGSAADLIEDLTLDEIELIHSCVNNATFISATGKILANQMRLGVRDMRSAAHSGDAIRASRAEGALLALERMLGLFKHEASKRKVTRSV